MKKGSILFDGIFIAFGLAMLIITVFFMYIWIDETATATQDTLNQTYFTKAKESLMIFDYMMPFIVIGLFMFMVVSAFFLQSHPIFFILSLLSFTIVIIFIPIISNMFNEFATNSSISSTANLFPYSVTIMNNLPLIVAAFSTLVIIVLHMKKGGGGDIRE